MADRFKEWTEDVQVTGGDLTRTVRELIEDITVSRIVVRRPNGTKLFELPAVAGLAAGVMLGYVSLVAVGVARLANFRIHVVRRQEVPAEDDLEVIIEEILDDTSWPDEPTEDIPITDTTPKSDESEGSIQIEDFDVTFDDDEEITIVDNTPTDKSEPKKPKSPPKPKKPAKPKEEAVEIAVEVTEVTVKDEDVDLSVVKGIGPKYQTLLKEAGINSYSALADMKLADLRAIFEKAGGRQPDVSTWRKQAKMAAAGEWKKLEKFQAK